MSFYRDPMRRLPDSRLLAAVCCCALGIGACGGSTSRSATATSSQANNPTTVLFLQPAASGTLAPTGSGTYTLSLQSDPLVTFFFDRPRRGAGQMATAALVNMWSTSGFKHDPPNAALEIAGATHSAAVFVFELTDPRQDPQSGRVQYAAKPAPKSGFFLDDQADAPPATTLSFQRATLFIDNVPAQTVVSATGAEASSELATFITSLRQKGIDPSLIAQVQQLQVIVQQANGVADQLDGIYSGSLKSNEAANGCASSNAATTIQCLLGKLKTANEVSQSTQLQLELRMTEIQQEWTVVSTALQTLNQIYMTLSRGIYRA
ncbi:MAG: hypothetical protein JO368_10920 [Acidimicrobiales bacterium]|nr:hypothetical protein [Acidimicrobiales bacterium]